MANPRKTIRLTVAQALVKYIAAQYSVADGVRERFIRQCCWSRPGVG